MTQMEIMRAADPDGRVSRAEMEKLLAEAVQVAADVVAVGEAPAGAGWAFFDFLKRAIADRSTIRPDEIQFFIDRNASNVYWRALKFGGDRYARLRPHWVDILQRLAAEVAAGRTADWHDTPAAISICRRLPLPQRLRQALADANLTGKRVADAVGVSPMTVSRWLNGHGTPSARHRRDLGRLFKLPATYFEEDLTP